MKKVKKTKKVKIAGLHPKEIETGYLYFTTAGQYRAVLAMHGEFLIYAPSSEGMEAEISPAAEMPFEHSPFKKCRIVTFAQKEYQPFLFNAQQALKHLLHPAQLEQSIQQCNAKAAIAALLADD